MTVVEMVSRIQEIRTKLGLPATTGVGATSGTDFADTLRNTVESTGSAVTGVAGTGVAGTGASGSGLSGADVVAAAKKYLGVPYKFGGTDPESGLDCSGFVQRTYADLGIKLPRVAKDQAKMGTAVPSLAQAQPGDLIAFHSPVDHIGIYVGGNKMIVAPKTGDHVKIQTVYTTPSTIRRILPDVSSVPAVPAVPNGTRVAAAPSLGTVIRPASLSGVPYAGLFQAAAAKYGVPATLLAAVAKVESNYNPNAVSKAGARGMMQIMPSTAAGLGINPLDPAQAIDGAARILAGNLKSFDSVPLAVAAYNAGGGAVRKYNGIPPYKETQAYVPKVEAAMTELSKRGFA
jgi:hypothetical protein